MALRAGSARLGMGWSTPLWLARPLWDRRLGDRAQLANLGEAVLARAVSAYRAALGSETGQVGTNTVAAGHYLASANAPSTTLVTAALAWRLEPPGDDEATALLRRQLIPLYVHYIDDHIVRLHAVNRHQLADRFQRWRTRLLAGLSDDLAPR